MAYRLRKVFGTLKKRAPGRLYQPGIWPLTLSLLQRTQLAHQGLPAHFKLFHNFTCLC